jgi:hypothetical protein
VVKRLEPEVKNVMYIYVFSSNNFTNICAGIGAGMWAVSPNLGKNKGTITKSRKLLIGSLGILYCSKTKEFTCPFIVKSVPVDRVIEGIWPEAWRLPFEITPLGSPTKRLSKDIVAAEMPSVVGSGKHWTKFLRVPPTFSFQTSELSSQDWAFLYERLRY